MKSFKIAVVAALLISCASASVHAACTLGTGTNYAATSGGADSPMRIAFSPNGNFCAVTNYNLRTVSILSYSAGVFGSPQSYPLTGDSFVRPFDVAFSPDGNYLVIGLIASSLGLCVFDFNSSNGVLSNESNYSTVFSARSIAFSPTGSHLATVRDSGVVSMMSFGAGVPSNRVDYAIPASGNDSATKVVFSSDDAYVGVANSGSDYVTVFQHANGVLSNGINYQLPTNMHNPSNVIFTKDTLRFLAGGNQGISAYDVALNGSLINGFDFAEGAFGQFSPSGEFLSVTGFDGLAYVNLVQYTSSILTDLVLTTRMPSGAVDPRSSAITPDGNFLVTVNEDSENLSVFPLQGCTGGTTTGTSTTGEASGSGSGTVTTGNPSFTSTTASNSGSSTVNPSETSSAGMIESIFLTFTHQN